VSLPLPLPGDASRAVAPPDDSEFPGGVRQRFRQLSPCVDALLDGYDAAFKGCVDSPSDGVGCAPPAENTQRGAVRALIPLIFPFVCALQHLVDG
jgi:hypothetical protein